MSSRPVRGGRTKTIIAKVQAQASRPIELGAALVCNASSGIFISQPEKHL